MTPDPQKSPTNIQYNEETHHGEADSLPEVPRCCQSCAHYRPTFYRLIGRECAAFTTTKGVLEDRCGFYAPR